MSSSSSSYVNSRTTVADSFIVVGFDPNCCDIEFKGVITSSETLDIHQLEFESVILNQYPNPKIVQIPQGVEYFCFPKGIQLSYEKVYPRFHSYIHTAEDGNRIIGCALSFYEEIEPDMLIKINQILSTKFHKTLSISEHQPIYIAKSISVLSKWAFLTSFKQYLTALYKISLQTSSIPLERYICNFIDDVPAPPAGKVDVSYYINEEIITFRCPPLNEPNAWSGFPLFPLFECLSAENICTLVTCLLLERQILFISSEYSLLTLCAEAVISLIYPFRWLHAYIPILPSKLLEAFGAPFPFIFGIDQQTYNESSSFILPETVRVFLDDDVIDLGSLGLPPPMPEARYRKLLKSIYENIPWYEQEKDKGSSTSVNTTITPLTTSSNSSSNNKINYNTTNNTSTNGPTSTLTATTTTTTSSNKSDKRTKWKTSRLQYFDNALSGVADRPIETSKGKMEDSTIRESFLRFFVNLFKFYRKYLVYTFNDAIPSSRFRSDEFIADQPLDRQQYLKIIVETQAFSQFVDERVMPNKLDKDVIFFDESINAKMNRYTFRFSYIDTPFLQYDHDKHIKTYVSPSPYTKDLKNETNHMIEYIRFPSLNEDNYIAPRHLTAKFSGHSERLIGLLSKVRMQRKVVSSYASMNRTLSAASCVYSCFLLILSQFISHTIEEQTPNKVGNTKNGVPTFRILEPLQHRTRVNSILSELMPSFLMDDSTVSFYFKSQSTEIIEATKLAFQVLVEVFNCLTRMDYLPDEVIYRCIAEACADLKDYESLIDLIVFMDAEGLIPDHQIRQALVRALSQDVSPSTSYPPVPETPPPNSAIKPRLAASDVWEFQKWRDIARNNSVFVLRSTIPPQPGGTPREKESYFFTSSSTATTTTSSSTSNPASMSSTNGLSSSNNNNNNQNSKNNTHNSYSAKDTMKLLQQLNKTMSMWSINPTEGTIPNLTWRFDVSNATFFCISKKLVRQMQVCEKLLLKHFSACKILFESSPGMQCPNANCIANRPQTFGEVNHGWFIRGQDANLYTTSCIHCGNPFIPRFIVTVDTRQSSIRFKNQHHESNNNNNNQSNESIESYHNDSNHSITVPPPPPPRSLPPTSTSSTSTRSNSEKYFYGKEAQVLCELLSPWSLYKETHNLVFENGVAEIISKDFRTNCTVVFWNLIIFFRLRGLPMAYLLTNGSLQQAFPPKGTSIKLN